MSASRGRIVVGVLLVVMLVAVALVQSSARATVTSAPILFSGPSEERDSIVAFEARRAGAPPSLMIAVSHVENWAGDSTAVHPVSGATGLMQVMQFWADSFPAECYGSGSLTARQRNACIGARIAVRYFNECGNWNCALVWYVGARCTKRDTPYRCTRKTEVGETYVLEVVERYGRTDLSPARDAMAHGAWRTAQANYSGSARPARYLSLEPHSFGQDTAWRRARDPGAPLAAAQW